MKWIARWPGKILKPHNAEELMQLLGAGALNAYDHVYDATQKKWIRLVEVEEIQSQLESLLGFMPSVHADEAKQFQIPDFHPPSLLIQHVLAGDSEFEVEEFSFTAPVIEDHSEEVEFQKKLIEELQDQLQMAQEDQSVHVEVEKLQQEIAILKEEVSLQEEKGHKIQLDNVALKEKITELEESNAKANATLVSKEEKLEEYFKENEKIVSEFKKLAQNNQSLKSRINEITDKVEKERHKNKALKQNILKLNEGLVLMKRKGERDKSAIQNLEQFKKIHDAKEEQELNRLIGDSFEVDNSSVWWIKLEGEEKGPYSYSDMRSFMKYGKIVKSTNSKKTGGEWQELQSHFEFKNDVLCKVEERDGKKVQRFFIKRIDFRAPFYDLAQIEIGANTYKGYCSSLSVGGCFIELSKLDKLRMEKDGKVLVKIKAGTLSEELNLRASIRNISDKRPRGLGLQFDAITEAQKDVIISFVHQYVSSSSKKAA